MSKPDEGVNIVDFSPEKIQEILAKAQADTNDAKKQIKEDNPEAANLSQLPSIDMEKFIKAVAAEIMAGNMVPNKPSERIRDEFNIDLAGAQKQFHAATTEDKLVNPFSFRGKMLMTRAELRQYHTDDDIQKIRELQKMRDQVLICGVALARQWKCTEIEAMLRTKSFQHYKDRLESDYELIKAISTGGAGTGAEWIPTEMSGRIVELVDIMLRVQGVFEEIQMPTNPFEAPITTGFSEAKIISETVTDTPTSADWVPAGTVPTGKMIFNAKSMGQTTNVSYQATEDAVISMISTIERDLAGALARGMEQAIMNGDDNATHMDSDTDGGPTSLAARLWKGLRYYGLAANSGLVNPDGSGSKITRAILESVSLEMGKYGSLTSELVYLPGPKVYTNMRFSDDIGLWTVDKYGTNNAQILNGELGQVGGVPVVLTQYSREDLSATGVHTGTGAFGTLPLVFRPGFRLGRRGSVLLETDRNIKTQQNEMVISQRMDFIAPWGVDTDYPFVGLAVNLGFA